MGIPLVDLKAQLATIREEIFESIKEVVENTAFIKGPYVSKFEREYAEFLSVKHCIGVGNGTDALVVALRALGIGADDEVIVPAMTFIASSEAVTLAGGRVALADIDPVTRCIDPEGVRKAITPKTKGIIAVHLYGHAADMIELRKIADEKGLWILEDCAQAHCSQIDGKMIGTLGEMATFSFFPGKNLGAYGDAGCVVTNDDEKASLATKWANHGRIGKYAHEFEGMNSRLDGVQGAILSVKLPYIKQWTEARRAVADRYRENLRTLEERDLLVLPKDDPSHVYHLFVAETPRRDDLIAFLKERSIAAGIHYPQAIHTLQAYDYLGHKPEDFPVADKLANTCISLPVYPELELEQVDMICGAIKEFFSA